MAFHCVETWLCLRLQRGPIPSLKVAKGLLHLHPHKFGLNLSPNPLRVLGTVVVKQYTDSRVQTTPPRLAQAAGVAEHCPVGN